MKNQIGTSHKYVKPYGLNLYQLRACALITWTFICQKFFPI